MRKFVNHPPYVIDLPNDSVGTLFKNGTVLTNHFPVFTAQTFG
jgi:hypothetical protein